MTFVSIQKFAVWNYHILPIWSTSKKNIKIPIYLFFRENTKHEIDYTYLVDSIECRTFMFSCSM